MTNMQLTDGAADFLRVLLESLATTPLGPTDLKNYEELYHAFKLATGK